MPNALSVAMPGSAAAARASRDKLLWRGALVLAASALLIVLLAQFTDIDLALADLGYDAVAHRFPARDQWFAAVALHAWIKLPLVAAGAALIAAALLGRTGRGPRPSAERLRRLRASAALALLIPLSISVLKRLSSTHCPWSLDRYGGHTPYVRLLDALPPGIDAGGCFPAGHASSALWLAGLCIWWWPRRPRIAALVFVLGLAAGFALGAVQQWRGAHFLSHTLASMWITAAWLWLALLALAEIDRRVILPMT